MLFMVSADFFLKSTFSKNSFRNTIIVSNSLDRMSVLIWVQTVWKGNQQMTKVAPISKRVYYFSVDVNIILLLFLDLKKKMSQFTLVYGKKKLF